MLKHAIVFKWSSFVLRALMCAKKKLAKSIPTRQGGFLNSYLLHILTQLSAILQNFRFLAITFPLYAHPVFCWKDWKQTWSSALAYLLHGSMSCMFRDVLLHTTVVNGCYLSSCGLTVSLRLILVQNCVILSCLIAAWFAVWRIRLFVLTSRCT